MILWISFLPKPYFTHHMDRESSLTWKIIQQNIISMKNTVFAHFLILLSYILKLFYKNQNLLLSVISTHSYRLKLFFYSVLKNHVKIWINKKFVTCTPVSAKGSNWSLFIIYIYISTVLLTIGILISNFSHSSFSI